MARVISPTQQPQPRWNQMGEEAVTITLDKNEVVAVRNAVRHYHTVAMNNEAVEPTSLNGAGARVFDALTPIVKQNDWI